MKLIDIIYIIFAIACIGVTVLLSILKDFDWFIFLFQLLIVSKLIACSFIYFPTFKQK